MASMIREPRFLENEESKIEDEKKIEQIHESNKLTNEEKTAIYFNLQAAQAMKNRIDIYMDEEEENKTFQDIYELNRKIESKEFIQNFQNDNGKIQNRNSTFEIWS